MKKIALVLSFFLALGIRPSYAEEWADTVRILGVGNSWTRDSMRWLSAIAASAGVPVIVGHAYLGGSTLEDQWHGISDTSYTYTHAGQQQKVYSTYQYWKYTASENPVKTPSHGYKNGLAGIGVTLEYAVADEEWDWIVFQPEATYGAYGFDISKLEDAVKGMMDKKTASKVKTALLVPFSYPQGSMDYRSAFANAYNHGVMPQEQSVWDSLYRVQYNLIQDAAIQSGYTLVNVGKVIEAARKDPELSRCGYLLQRSRSNSHLAEGMPMYLASLAFGYELLGLTPGDIDFYPTVSTDSVITGDRGESIPSEFALTPRLAARAKELTYSTLHQ